MICSDFVTITAERPVKMLAALEKFSVEELVKLMSALLKPFSPWTSGQLPILLPMDVVDRDTMFHIRLAGFFENPDYIDTGYTDTLPAAQRDAWRIVATHGIAAVTAADRICYVAAELKRRNPNAFKWHFARYAA